MINCFQYTKYVFLFLRFLCICIVLLSPFYHDFHTYIPTKTNKLEASKNIKFLFIFFWFMVEVQYSSWNNLGYT